MEDLRLVIAQAKIPECNDCDAWDENPADFVEQAICPGCPRSEEVSDPLLWKLLHYEALLEAGCPLGRHELTNEEWLLLGMVRKERERITIKEAKRHGTPRT